MKLLKKCFENIFILEIYLVAYEMHNYLTIPSSEESSEEDSTFFSVVLAAPMGFLVCTSCSVKKA